MLYELKIKKILTLYELKILSTDQNTVDITILILNNNKTIINNKIYHIYIIYIYIKIVGPLSDILFSVPRSIKFIIEHVI